MCVLACPGSGVVFRGRWENGRIVQKGELSHLPPPGTTLGQPALPPSSQAIGAREMEHGLEDLDAIIKSHRRPTGTDGGPRMDGVIDGGGGMHGGFATVHVPAAVHIVPVGGAGGEEGRGNEWDVESVSSRASECDTTSHSLGAGTRDPAAWHPEDSGEGAGKRAFSDGEVEMMAGMPEAMATGVGVPASALLEAALKRVLAAGSDGERADAQNAIRAGLVQLDADRRKRSLKRIKPRASAGAGAEKPATGLQKVHEEVSELLAQHAKAMDAVRGKHAVPPARSGGTRAPSGAAGASGSERGAGVHAASRRAAGHSDDVNRSSGQGVGLSHADLLMFLTHEAEGKQRGSGGSREIGAHDHAAGPEDSFDQSKKSLRSIVTRLELRTQPVGEARAGGEAARLQMMKGMGIDTSMFEGSSGPLDEFGSDVDFVTGLLKRSDGTTPAGAPESGGGEETEMEVQWRHSLAASMAAADKAREEMEARKRSLEEQRLAAVLQEARAAREKEDQERRLRKELAVAAAQERAVREEQERRALMLQLEAELLVELEMQRRATEVHRDAASAIKVRRELIAKQREAAVHRPPALSGGFVQDGASEKEVFVLRLKEALAGDFVSFQRSFRMHVPDEERDIAQEAVAEALRTASRPPAAPAVAIILEAVAAHNKGELVMGQLMAALSTHGYQHEHNSAAQVLQRWTLACLARLERERAEEEVREMEREMHRLERERQAREIAERLEAERVAEAAAEAEALARRQDEATAAAMRAGAAADEAKSAGIQVLMPSRSELEEAEAAAAAILEILGEDDAAPAAAHTVIDAPARRQDPDGHDETLLPIPLHSTDVVDSDPRNTPASGRQEGQDPLLPRPTSGEEEGESEEEDTWKGELEAAASEVAATKIQAIARGRHVRRTTGTRKNPTHVASSAVAAPVASAGAGSISESVVVGEAEAEEAEVSGQVRPHFETDEPAGMHLADSGSQPTAVDFTFACFVDSDRHLGDVVIPDGSPWHEMCARLSDVAGFEAVFSFAEPGDSGHRLHVSTSAQWEHCLDLFRQHRDDLEDEVLEIDLVRQDLVSAVSAQSNAPSADEAATRIQAVARGRRARTRAREHRRRLEEEEEAARVAEEERLLEEDRLAREAVAAQAAALEAEGAATKIQAVVRGRRTRSTHAHLARGPPVEELVSGGKEEQAEASSGGVEQDDEMELYRTPSPYGEDAGIEAEYSQEIAATKIQAIARGRRVRRDAADRGVSAAGDAAPSVLHTVPVSAGEDSIQDHVAVEEEDEGEACEEGRSQTPPQDEVLDEVDDAPAAPSERAAEMLDAPVVEEGGEDAEEDDMTPQERRRRIVEARVARMPMAQQAESKDQAAQHVAADGSVGAGEGEPPKKEKRRLRPLPAVTAPHNQPAVAIEIMTEALGDGPDVWRIDSKDLTMIKKVGEGNFAQVYRAKLKREECAVKRFTHQSMSATDFHKFAHETAFLHKLRHPHICQLYGACIDPDNLCIVTEFVPNDNLHNVLTKKKIREPKPVLDWRTRVQMGIDLASAVAFLHAQTPAVLHLDIKSPNLLVDQDMRLKLADFGLARWKQAADEVAEKETFQPGTVHWMAPELMMQGIKTEKTDVYAIGIVLWELWVMKTPYAGLKVNEIASKVKGQGARPTVPSEVLPSLLDNANYKDMMEECWHDKASVRPTAAEVQRRLGLLLGALSKPAYDD